MQVAPATFYCHDMDDPAAFKQNPGGFKPTIAEESEWYDKRHSDDYCNKLVYRYEKTIPQIVQDVLE